MLNDYDAPPAFPPPSAKVKVTFGAASRCGHSHQVNEDHYAVIQLGRHQETLMTSLPAGVVAKRFDEHGFAMMAADGMGGSDTGELASRLALTTLMQLVLHFGKWNLRFDAE